MLHNSEFAEWFGGSQVVDADCAPQVVFHGTLQGDFDDFAVGDFFGSGFFGRGINFTSCPYDASKYAADDAYTNLDLPGKASVLAERCRIDYKDARALLTSGGGTVIPAYLAIKKPLRVGSGKLAVREIVFQLAVAEAEWKGDAAALYRKFASCTTGAEQFQLLQQRRATRVFRQIASLQLCDGLIIDPACAPLSKGATHYLVFDAGQVRSAILHRADAALVADGGMHARASANPTASGFFESIGSSAPRFLHEDLSVDLRRSAGALLAEDVDDELKALFISCTGQKPLYDDVFTWALTAPVAAPASQSGPLLELAFKRGLPRPQISAVVRPPACPPLPCEPSPADTTSDTPPRPAPSVVPDFPE